jgi:hypothetical protein
MDLIGPAALEMPEPPVYMQRTMNLNAVSKTELPGQMLMAISTPSVGPEMICGVITLLVISGC